jgi:hypothetical protein
MTDATTTTIQFVCPQERAVLGTLQVQPGETVNAEMIRESMDSAHGRRDDGATLRADVRDGSYLMCPRCDAMLMIGLEGADIDTVLADRFVALVGSFQYPDSK